ncbi:hypothetical protein ACUNV4_09190 [Granulosicoccus sp. 3-233]|uniref:hypothetical protein n=1 Tax=Granulosicoccus sp. 3-233 TaxID=3417969 RepID=UPI003D337906
MLLDSKRIAVEQAWLRQCEAQATLDHIAHECKEECNDYFSRPAALLWPFAAGVLLTRFRRAAPATLEVTSLALSAIKVAGKASPLIKRFLT